MAVTTFSDRALVLKRQQYGDFDLIVHLLTRGHGKITTIAKAAKKSVKRFGGTLEPFAELKVVWKGGKGMPILSEASLERTVEGIRTDLVKMAYASYWVEVIDRHLEPYHRQPESFTLLRLVLERLEAENRSVADLSVLFHMRFLMQAGLNPGLDQCRRCQRGVEQLAEDHFYFDTARGGIICSRCKPGTQGRMSLSVTTIRQLMWIAQRPLAVAQRIRLSPQALLEGERMLEAFITYHSNQTPRSLTFLRQLRCSQA